MSKKRVHILGICGTFMGGLALLGKEKGMDISGCDNNVYPPMSDHLNDMGIEIIESYDPSHLPKADEYVIGNSIMRGNPALEHLLSSKANIISGPEWLYSNILKNRKVIAVSGTHGKTTTTAMIAWIFQDQGIETGYLIAGKPKDFEKSARKGKQDIFVLEADEYDTAFFDKRSKFIHYKPDTLIINNLEFDHADIFPDLSYIYREFHNLIRTLKEEAEIIFPKDDLNISNVLNLGCWSKLIDYSFNEHNINSINFSNSSNKTYLTIENEKGELDWSMLGEHNARNAMVALLAVNIYGIKLTDGINSLKKFKGVAKRQDLLMDEERLLLIEDFAHHPTAIETTLKGIKKAYSNRKIYAAIELRSNTMKSGFHDDRLINVCSLVDKVFWKSEDKDQAKKLVEALPDKSSQIINIENFIDEFKQINRKGDVLVVMSNGNFDNLSQLLMNEFKK